MTERFDVVVVGAGHNGLAAAVTLAEAGRRVLVAEAAPRPGGALRSAALTLPGHVHDVMATNLNLFLASPFYAVHADALRRHGFRIAACDQPFASAFPDGSALGVTTDRAKVLEHMDARDARGWRELDDLYERISPALFRLYAARAPSLALARAGTAAVRDLGVRGSADLGRLLLSSCRELLDDHLVSEKAKALVAPWGLHLDFAPDVAGGAVFPFLEAFSDQRAGISVAAGGASMLVDALVGALREQRGEVRTSSRVTRIVVRDGRATGVEIEGSGHVHASEAVVASVTPRALAADLLAGSDLGDRMGRSLRTFRYGPGTLMLHLALSSPVPWRAGAWLGEFAYVHLAPYMDDLARAYADAVAGRLPGEPLLVVGQSTAVDPTRAPPSRHVLWVQVRPLPAGWPGPPPSSERDASRQRDAVDRYVARVMAKLERYAPGIGSCVTGTAVFSPADLEREDENLVGGDSVSGSMHLRQNFLWRPTWGMAGYRTPVRALWMIGASTWPGGGLNAISGYSAAQAILRERRAPRVGPRWRGRATR